MELALFLEILSHLLDRDLLAKASGDNKDILLYLMRILHLLREFQCFGRILLKVLNICFSDLMGSP